MGYMQEYAKDKKKLAQEFEAILLKEVLKGRRASKDL